MPCEGARKCMAVSFNFGGGLGPLALGSLGSRQITTQRGDPDRERAEFLALETLTVMLLRTLCTSAPGVERSLRAALAEQAGKLAATHPKDASAERGDLLMGELEEAFERLAARVLGN